VIGDDTARRLEALISENRSRIEALDRRLQEIEATLLRHSATSSVQDTTGDTLPVPTPAPLTLAELRMDEPVKQPFDRKGYHTGYMRRWRARRKALLNGDYIG
jgi:hypothetical protein